MILCWATCQYYSLQLRHRYSDGSPPAQALLTVLAMDWSCCFGSTQGDESYFGGLFCVGHRSITLRWLFFKGADFTGMVNQKLYSQHGRTEQYLRPGKIGPHEQPVMACTWWGYCLCRACLLWGCCFVDFSVNFAAVAGRASKGVTILPSRGPVGEGDGKFIWRKNAERTCHAQAAL